jgi:hypothetical protein
VISSPQGLYLITGQQNKHIHIPNIHALCRIRNHDPGFQASEDSACLRPLGYRDRKIKIPLQDNIRMREWSIILKHPVACIYRTIYSAFNATISTLTSPPYNTFRPQAAIINCFVYAKPVVLYTIYQMFTYLYTCKCDVSCLIYLTYTRYLIVLSRVGCL